MSVPEDDTPEKPSAEASEPDPLDFLKGDHLYPIQELKTACPDCGGDANFQNWFVLRRSVFGDKKPWLRMKMDLNGSDFSMDTQLPVLPGSFYFLTRLSCVDCGHWDQETGASQEAVEAMLERRKKLFRNLGPAAQR
jgi:hypothetical protein